jgi:thiamine pyrophosphate-dependent acetolactate synthase large subunit-like protein
VLGTDGFQEVDIASITAPVTKHNYLVPSTQELPQIIKEAFHIAQTGRPGPVLVSVATDVQTGETDYVYPDRVDLPGRDPARKQADGAQDLRADHRLPEGTNEESWDGAFRTVVQQILESTRGDIVLGSNPVGGTHDLHNYGPRALLSPGSMQTKGSALPAAIGAQIAPSHEQVWVLIGDDGMQVTIQELATVFQEGLPLLTAIINQGRTAARLSTAAGEATPGEPLLGPNFARLAEAYGIPGGTVTNWSRAGSVIAQASACSGPVLVDFQLAR